MPKKSLYALFRDCTANWPDLYRQLFQQQLGATTDVACRIHILQRENDQRLRRGMHCHMTPELFLQVSGFSTFHSPGGSLTLYPGEICLAPTGVPHLEVVGAHAGRPFHNIVAAISESRIDVHAAHAEAGSDKPKIIANSSIQREVGAFRLVAHLEDLAEAANAAGETGGLMARGLLMASLAQLVAILASDVRPGRGLHPKVVQARQYIGRSLALADLNVQSVAEWLQCSPDYLSHLFHRETGVRLAAYINRCRIRHSRELLDSTALNISEVAWACGYRDAGYFARVFKRTTGQSPREYRRRQQ